MTNHLEINLITGTNTSNRQSLIELTVPKRKLIRIEKADEGGVVEEIRTACSWVRIH